MKQRHRWLIGVLVVVALAALVLIAPGEDGAIAQGGIIYVDADAAGAGVGTSWTDAFTTLQPALTEAESGTVDEIWVAEGTYKPTWLFSPGDSRSATFQMVNGVAIYGGFAGTETELGQRDWVTAVTILSGDIGSEGDISDNSYHVFYHPEGTNLDDSAVLDGFTISGGNANEYPHNSGGGMYNYGSSPTLANCTLAGNSAAYGGGGMYNYWYSSPTLTKCVFTGNSANYGGALWTGFSSPMLTDCTFAGNSANSGGGMFNDYVASPVLTNCTFASNSATWNGGGMANYDASPVLTNCTFSGNLAGQNGGAMYNFLNFMSPSPTLTNCVLWGDSPNEIFNSDSTPDVTYSDVQGSYSGTGNIDAEPLFVDPASGDFRLGPDSPCIDAGNPDASNLPPYDFEGDDRVLDGNGDGTAIVDMGVDEVVYSGPPVVEVEIDVRPGSDQNPINLGSGGVVPVAILTTDEFDTSTVRPASVRFAGAQPRRWTMEDVDRDGDLDLLLNFRIRQLELNEYSTEATLTGETFPHAGGVLIEGTDTVRIIP